MNSPVLCVLAPDDIPQPNAKRAASGKIVAIASGGGVPCKRGRRGQTKNALYSTALSGFDWGRWTKWQYPRKVGDARERCASVESSALRGHYTKLLVLYPDAMNNVPEKKNRAKMRKCARLLVETHRSVRHSDGSVGKMVGAGEHMSYNGLVEARAPSPPHPSPLTPHLAPSHIRSPSRLRSCSHASASVVVRTTWRARWRWPPVASRCSQAPAVTRRKYVSNVSVDVSK